LSSIVSDVQNSSCSKAMPWLAAHGKQPINQLLQALHERRASQHAVAAKVCRCYLSQDMSFTKAGLVAHVPCCAHLHLSFGTVTGTPKTMSTRVGFRYI
jgi:hypothetical protein